MFFFALRLSAQHDHMHMHHHTSADTVHARMDSMQMNMDLMCHAYSLNLPMNRNASGTSWQPDASPVFGYMQHAGPWMLMEHGNIFLRYTHQDIGGAGARGGERWDAPNWFMLMGQRMTGPRGLFHFSAMLSLDPLTEGGEGYPLLFQTGESWKNTPLVDHQHPHDLFSELSVSYAHAFTHRLDVFAYVGYPGEPALGSGAFMHRASALTNPDAPIGHHWNDATHITFGVATLGIRYGMFKLEASNFTGREPDEDRYGFDTPRFDSWSGRVSFAPSANWTMQVSQGFIKSPEALHPEEDIDRTTASVQYGYAFDRDRFLNATVLWGVNRTTQQPAQHSILAEGNFLWKQWSTYLRYEWIRKSGEELVLEEEGFAPAALFAAHSITAGGSYDLLRERAVNVALGGQVSLLRVDERLQALYGKTPVSAEVYLRVYPRRMMTSMFE